MSVCLLDGLRWHVNSMRVDLCWYDMIAAFRIWTIFEQETRLSNKLRTTFYFCLNSCSPGKEHNLLTEEKHKKVILTNNASTQHKKYHQAMGQYCTDKVLHTRHAMLYSMGAIIAPIKNSGDMGTQCIMICTIFMYVCKVFVGTLNFSLFLSTSNGN